MSEDINQNELEYADIVVSLWAIDDGLAKMERALQGISDSIEEFRKNLKEDC